MAKARGRRVEKASKAEKAQEPEEQQNDEQPTSSNINSFFGLVDSAELEYFKQAESSLNVNAFETPEERLNFVFSVFEESKGKELKLVTNQICSKLVERLIQSGNEQQIKQLFRAFNGNFIQLCNQKYSSHVMETFLVRSASLIEKELLRKEEDQSEQQVNDEDDEAYVSMENAFLFMLTELKPHLKAMVVHQYATHVLRILLLVVAGRELPSSIQSNSILRSKKSKIARKMIEIKDNEDYQKQYQIPSSFKEELSEILKTIITGQDTVSLREWAIEQRASPVLQMLIQLEGLVDKERSFWCLTFNKSDQEKDPKEESFVEYLLSDAIGSHFFETAISSQKLKNINRLYRLYMKDRILKLAKRETTGVFVVMMMMKKLKPVQQLFILDQLVPALNELIVNNLEIGSAIVECSINNNNYKREDIIQKFFEFFNKSLSGEPTEDKSQILENVLRLSASTLGNTKDDWPTAEERRRSLFLEKLIEYDSQFAVACIDGLMNLPEERLIQMCKHGVFSHVVESCLDADKVDLISRKRFLNVILTHIPDLSCNAQASHIVDKLWPFTIKLNNYKDRIARLLFENKDQIKNSVYGKMVWKNWGMEMFSRKLYDWKRLIKQEEYAKYPPGEPKSIANDKSKDDRYSKVATGHNDNNNTKDATGPHHRNDNNNFVHTDRKRMLEDAAASQESNKKIKRGRNRN